MCVSTQPSKMSKTIVSCVEARHPEGQLVHVVGYQNVANSSGPNAMLLAFPTKTPMTAKNMIDTSKHSNVMKAYRDALPVRQTRSLSFVKDVIGSRSTKGYVEVFAQGSYHVVLVDDTADIGDALDQVPVAKRPTIDQDFLNGYSRDIYHSGKWKFALCCWSGTVEAEPMMFWYEPTDPAMLFLPGMDAHDGGLPVQSKSVSRDHALILGSALMSLRDGYRVGIKNPPWWVASYVKGNPQVVSSANGDWYCRLDGDFSARALWPS